MAVTADQLQREGLVVILRSRLAVDLVSAAEALMQGGVRAIEATLTTPGALDAVRELRRIQGDNAFVGVGTVLDGADAQEALDAGAEFLVTPTLQLDTISLCRKRQIPLFCGAFTPTEALAAHRAGADFIKVFPAELLGPEGIRAWLAPLPFLRLAPTGGVGLENIASYFAAGSVAVGVGGSLASETLLQAGLWDELSQRAIQFTAAVSEARATRNAQQGRG